MEVTFLGGASEVGASSTLLQVAGHYLLIDGGMRPAAREGQSRLPDLSLLDATPPEALLLTHAHIDHTGALPLIASLSPHIPIYATESTRVLTEILLRDAGKIMEEDLWETAYARGPAQPWTSVEQGQQYYGPSYSPQFRSKARTRA